MKTHNTICSVHGDIREIFDDIISIVNKAEKYDNIEDFATDIERAMDWAIEYVNEATDMGLRMEEGLKEKKERVGDLEKEVSDLEDTVSEMEEK